MVTFQQVLRAVAAAEGDTVEGVAHAVRGTIAALGLELDSTTGEVSVYGGSPPIMIAPLLAAVAKGEGDTVAGIEHVARETIRALGLDVNTITGEIYNPAEGVYYKPAPQVRPRDDRWRAKRKASR